MNSANTPASGVENEKPLAAWEQVLLTLCCFAILLPTAAQSIITGLLFIWFLFHKAWRRIPFFQGRQRQPWATLWRDEPVISFITWAVLLSTIIQIILLFFQMAWVVEGIDSSKIIKSHLRLMGKLGIYGLVVMFAFLEAHRRTWDISKALNLLCILVALLTLYVFIQRYTGINWVHGWNARLPDHRLAYDVYRVSGFMGHPLTFAYNLLIFTLFCFGFAISPKTAAAQRWKWLSLCMMTLTCLLISGSRWPLFLAVLLMLLSAGKKLLRSRLVWLASLFAIIWLVAIDQGTVNRFKELFEPNATRIEERFSRLVFWKVHWAMFQDQPIAGTGYVNRDQVRLDYYKQEGYTDIGEKYSAHNIFLQTLADSGIIGFLSLSSLLFGALAAGYLVWKRDHVPGLFLIAVATVLTGLMQNNLRDSEYLFALWASFAWYLASRKEADLESGKQIENHQSRADHSYYQSNVRRENECPDPTPARF